MERPFSWEEYGINAETFLNGAYKIKTELDVNKQVLEEGKTLISEISDSEDEFNSVGEHNTAEEYSEFAERLVEPLDTIETYIRRLYDRYVGLFEVIGLIDDSRQKLIVMMRCIQHKDWDCIAKELGCSAAEFDDLKRRTLRTVDEILHLED